MTLAGPLAPNMPLTAVTPLAFTLSDGVQTMANHTINSAFFVLATGPTGQISGWAVDVDGPFEFDGVNYNARILTDNTMQFVTDSGSVLMPVAVGEQVSAEIARYCASEATGLFQANLLREEIDLEKQAIYNQNVGRLHVGHRQEFEYRP